MTTVTGFDVISSLEATFVSNNQRGGEVRLLFLDKRIDRRSDRRWSSPKSSNLYDAVIVFKPSDLFTLSKIIHGLRFGLFTVSLCSEASPVRGHHTLFLPWNVFVASLKIYLRVLKMFSISLQNSWKTTFDLYEISNLGKSEKDTLKPKFHINRTKDHREITF